MKTIISISEAKSEKQFTVTQVLPEDAKLIKALANLMYDCNYSTTQREDAQEIMDSEKMDAYQVELRFDSIALFCGQLKKSVLRMKRDAKQEMKDRSI